MGLVNIFSNNLIGIITFHYCLVLHCMAMQGSINSACLMDGWLPHFFFAVDAILNDAAVTVVVHVSFQIRVFIFSRYIPRNEIAASYGNSMFSF